MKELIRSLLRSCGFELVRYRFARRQSTGLRDLSDANMLILNKIISCAIPLWNGGRSRLASSITSSGTILFSAVLLNVGGDATRAVGEYRAGLAN